MIIAAVCAVVVLVLIILLGYYFWRHKQYKVKPTPPSTQQGESNPYMEETWEFSDLAEKSSCGRSNTDIVGAVNTKILGSSARVSGDVNEDALETEEAAIPVSNKYECVWYIFC